MVGRNGASHEATFVALREAANRLRDNGRIVLVSSGATLTHRPGSGVFGASKAAVEQLVRVLARELAPRGITANSMLPGAVRTDALASARVALRLRIARPPAVADPPLRRMACRRGLRAASPPRRSSRSGA
ncbi:SDR family NAD(P)-dependent oxidoreductase [Nocardia gamkensis]|uniref:SDR family NAD(P)-dependent oxidoreductase n=1 Tax=Nocardia gamkensis TaxID=352869 RepID=UPI0037CAC396